MMPTMAIAQYEGLRVQCPGQQEVYLVMEGKRRHIPDLGTYDNLFGPQWHVQVDPIFDQIPRDVPLSPGAYLGRPGGPKVYLCSNGMRRWITDPAVMNKYGFQFDRVRVGFGGELPEGPPIL